MRKGLDSLLFGDLRNPEQCHNGGHQSVWVIWCLSNPLWNRTPPKQESRREHSAATCHLTRWTLVPRTQVLHAANVTLMALFKRKGTTVANLCLLFHSLMVAWLLAWFLGLVTVPCSCPWAFSSITDHVSEGEILAGRRKLGSVAEPLAGPHLCTLVLRVPFAAFSAPVGCEARH